MSMLKVGKVGKFYTLNGQIVMPKNFRMVSLFKFVNHLVAWADGGAHDIGGGVHLANAKRTLEREVVGLGFKCARAPVELMMWGPPYFDVGAIRVGEVEVEPPEPWRGWSNVANTLSLVNLRSGTGSSFQLSAKMKKVIRMMVVLAREFDIVFEIPWVWTMKAVSGGYTNARLGFSDGDPRRRFDSNRPQQGGVGIWNEHFLGERGVGAYLHTLETDGDGTGVSRVDPGPLNLRHDFMNERTAHVGDPDPDKTNEWDESQLMNLARRWKTRDAPGQMAEISESGKVTYRAPLASVHGDRGFDTVAAHPPRGPGWVVAPLSYREKWPNELLNFNESQMAWTKEQKELWVTLIPKWEGLGSTDLDSIQRMYENMEKADGYICAHTLRGMDGGWPNTPQTAVEEMLREFNEVSGGPPPVDPDPETWPPDDPSKRPYDHLVTAAYREILKRAHIGEEGRHAWNHEMEAGMTNDEMRDEFMRSEEFKKKNTGPWDYEVEPPVEPPVDTNNPKLYIVWRCEDPPEAPTCRDRFEWARSLDLAYTPHRGHRDLRSLLTEEGHRYLKDGDRQILDETPAELLEIIEQMELSHARSIRLQDRIVNQKHDPFDPRVGSDWHRSQVRKDVANAMRGRMEGETATYMALAHQFPQVPGCDTIGCKIVKWNEDDPPFEKS